MKFPDENRNLRIELDTKNCTLSAAEIERIEHALDPLRAPLKKFPVTDLYVTIESFPRSNDYRVKLALQLPGKGLVTGDVDEQWYPAIERCARKLLHRVVGYEDELSEEEDRHKHLLGTRHEVVPEQVPDAEALERAVRNTDYPEFRRLLLDYEESLRKRIGRWIARYPLLEAQLGERFDVADVVEEVFLNAFERFDQRPNNVRFGDWLEGLIDPSLKLLDHAPDEELENISFARSSTEAESP